jgi:hypothetical protein
MEPAELQTNLEELEERIDRVRALYEQYFCGIEKLEPQIPRKDVDRRIVVLRKEQIRNTAMRFKFQTLVQRYNTMSQHWGRVLREIENGTFKRDLARAAARFGVEDALTAVGKKRAKGLAKGLEAQLDRQARKKQQQKKEDEYEVVDDADFEAVEDFDDDAPTPPPVRVAPPPGAHPLDAVPSIDDFDDDPRTDISEPPPVAAHQQRPGHGAFGRAAQAQQQAQYAQPHQAQPAYAQPHQAQHQYAQPQAQHPQAQHPQATPYMPPVASEAQRSSAPTAEPKKGGGGLRLGGGPAKRVNQAALNRIAGALDDDDDPPARRPLMSAPLDIDVGPEPAAAPPPAASPPARAQPAPSPAPAPVRKPLLSGPIDIDIPVGERPSAPPAAAPAPPAALGLKPPPKVASDPGLRPQPKPAVRSEDKPSRSENKDLSDQRLREIYAQYVNTRRERNESTAGITFEKLADSLRSQADKLKSKHTAKKVDYEVVVKDGKTLIKPIVR